MSAGHAAVAALLSRTPSSAPRRRRGHGGAALLSRTPFTAPRRRRGDAEAALLSRTPSSAPLSRASRAGLPARSPAAAARPPIFLDSFLHFGSRPLSASRECRQYHAPPHRGVAAPCAGRVPARSRRPSRTSCSRRTPRAGFAGIGSCCWKMQVPGLGQGSLAGLGTAGRADRFAREGARPKAPWSFRCWDEGPGAWHPGLRADGGRPGP
jgi:hypothetical protein